VHDGDAETGHDRRRIEREHFRRRAAQHRSGSRGEQAGEQRRQRAEARDQQRSEHRGAGKQHRRQAGQDPDLRFRHAEFGADQRDDGRHRQDGDAQAVAGEPEQQNAKEDLPAARGGGFGRGTHQAEPAFCFTSCWAAFSTVCPSFPAGRRAGCLAVSA
jgi:hypothetical protein